MIKIFILLFFIIPFSYEVPRNINRFLTRESLSSKDREMFDKTVTVLDKLEEYSDKINDIKNKTDDVEVGVMSNPDMFQGDIFLSESQIKKVKKDFEVDNNLLKNKLRKKRSAILENMPRFWDISKPIKYFVNDGNTDMITESLNKITSESCISFEYSPTLFTGPGFRFYRGVGCWSWLGKIDNANPQDISLGTGCDAIGTIQHEVFHALGFVHEQSRPDRDFFLKIHNENYTPDKATNFYRYGYGSANNYGIIYDYGSVMQYYAKSFSSNGGETMTPKMSFFDNVMGQSVGYSHYDLKLLNTYYCKNVCTSSIICNNGGFQSVKDCSKCRCPLGFSGISCNEIEERSSTCTNKINYSNSTKQTINVPLGAKCFYYIEAPIDKKIMLVMKDLKYNGYYYTPCNAENGVEIKYRTDMGLTGGMFCKPFSNEILISQGNKLLIAVPGNVKMQFTFHSK
ncbi:Astacin-like metalloendopeptidase [Strongyloides ratti]|uniref:Zinc metalloproteinase n=1 Tax=Strongyloides ratti TaxID=34506 RepID=A0A090N001_STRRB|nr:Astacin-like metalloendopeptidase [Strongyloides ratti]CEF69825.2 Astacin-like metalloendopeptidase [Strongyloides ratti]